MTHRYFRPVRAADSSLCSAGACLRLAVVPPVRVDDSVFILLTLISPVSHRPALAAVRMSQRTPAVQLLCIFTLFLFRPSSVNKHLVAVSYSQLLCASGFCRSERCQFTDQRDLRCNAVIPVRSAVLTHTTGLERNVRPSGAVQTSLYRLPAFLQAVILISDFRWVAIYISLCAVNCGPQTTGNYSVLWTAVLS